MPVIATWHHIGMDNVGLSFNVQDFNNSGNFTFDIDINKDQFNKTQQQRILQHILTLLRAFTNDPNQLLEAIPMLLGKEAHLVLHEFNHPQATTSFQETDMEDFHTGQGIHHLFETQADQTPDAMATVYGDEHLTYGQLNVRANQLAHHLQNLGVGPNMIVAIAMERSLNLIIALLGILKAGGAYLPLDPTYPEKRIAFMLQDTQAKVLLTQEHIRHRIPPSTCRVMNIESILNNAYQKKANLSSEPLTSNHLASIMYTSGSTGHPKGVCVLHQGVVRLVKKPNYADLTTDKVFLQFAPLPFDASTFEIWGALLNGGRLILSPAQTPSLEKLALIIQQTSITTLWLTASLFH